MQTNVVLPARTIKEIHKIQNSLEHLYLDF